MHVIIAGCGRVGSLVARTLSGEGHDVVVIDREQSSFDRLGAGFNGLTLRGFEFDQEILKQAGIETADVFVAATASDSGNAMAALMAQQMFGVERVVCRIYEPEHEYAFQRLGLVTVTASTLAANKIHSELLPSGYFSDLLLADAQGEVIRFHPTVDVAGRRVEEIEEDGRFRITAILRGEQGKTLVIPTSQTALEADDVLLAVIQVAELPFLRERFGF